MHPNSKNVAVASFSLFMIVSVSACSDPGCPGGDCIDVGRQCPPIEPPLRAIACGQAWPRDIAVDSEYVYWTTSSGLVLAKAKTGGLAGVLSRDVSFSGVHLSAMHRGLFWAQGSEVYQWDPETQSASAIPIGDPGGVEVASDDHYVYASSENSGWVRRFSRVDGTTESVVENASRPRSLTLGGGWVYFVTQTGTTGSELRRVAANGGEIETISVETGVISSATAAELGIAWGANTCRRDTTECAFFPGPQCCDASTKHRLHSATSTSLLFVGANARVEDVALFGGTAYWTSPGAVYSVQVGVEGGAPTTITSNVVRPGQIAVDATGVFWVDRMSYGDTVRDEGLVMQASW